jgi:chain length determinant protein (polysaccharide antigen chain regulator)
MPNSPEQSQAYNDEIDLTDLVRALWQGKWLVIGVTIVTLALGQAYLMTLPKNYTASLEISALPVANADIYTELNLAEFMPAVDEERLLISFLDDVRSLESLEHIIKSSNYITQQEDETDKEFVSRLGATAKKFSIVSNSKKTGDTSFMLIFTTQKPILMKEIVDKALTESNQNVNDQLLDMFQRRVNSHKRKIDNELVDVGNLKSRSLERYQNMISAKLTMLIEHAQIARALNLTSGSIFSQTLQNNSILLNSSQSNNPLYLRGYVALETEIKLIKLRKDPDNLIDEMGVLKDRELKLLQNRTVQRAEQYLADTPIGTDQFSAAVYNLDTLVYKNNTKTSLILALSIVLGGMLGIFVLLIRNVLIKQD